MNNLKDIHNLLRKEISPYLVVILGFQWTIWRTYTTSMFRSEDPECCYIRISMNNLKDIHNEERCDIVHHIVVILGFQWTIWRTYTTFLLSISVAMGCYIRISMNNLKDIHNKGSKCFSYCKVVILGFQWTIWRTYTTK